MVETILNKALSDLVIKNYQIINCDKFEQEYHNHYIALLNVQNQLDKTSDIVKFHIILNEDNKIYDSYVILQSNGKKI